MFAGHDQHISGLSKRFLDFEVRAYKFCNIGSVGLNLFILVLMACFQVDRRVQSYSVFECESADNLQFSLFEKRRKK